TWLPSPNFANENPWGVVNLHNSHVVGDSVEGDYFADSTPKPVIHFKSSEKIPAKSNTFIMAGTYNDIDAYLNDYSVYLGFNDRWIIKQVSIEIE
ncbi:MAG TPA: hypothetical protein VH500_02660, partial [Nitrososphaeraceae archaeon]